MAPNPTFLKSRIRSLKTAFWLKPMHTLVEVEVLQENGAVLWLLAQFSIYP